MIKEITNTVKNFDLKIKDIMIKGLRFSLIVSIIGTMFLLYYISFKNSLLIYYIGLKIVALSISLGSSFFACAFAIDKIKKDLE